MSFIIAGAALTVMAIAVWKYRYYRKKYYDAINPPKKEGKRTKREVYEITRSQILLRDHFRCRECGYYKHLEVHHIVPRSKGGTDDPSNLITLCGRCHAKKHGYAWRENRRKRRHTRRNRHKKLKKYLKEHKSDLSDEATKRRKKLYEKWQQNKLNQPEN
jgi:5-methylcytosine-specific restriction endonuclease McrA